MSQDKTGNKDSYTTNYEEPITSTTVMVRNANEDHLNHLLPMIRKANTTSVLNTLEEYRKNLSEMAFRLLISLLTEEFNKPTWIIDIQQQNTREKSQKYFLESAKREIPTANDINRCLLIIIYYVVSVINKYKIIAVESVWTEMLKNRVTQTITFYCFLYKNKIIIPNAICTSFSEELRPFYSSRSCEDKIKLILLGFTLNRTTMPYMRIKDYEKLFSELKQQVLFSKNLKPQQLISSMNTPEELSLFLSYFSDYDLNTIDPNTNYNVLDQVINMKPYFYQVPNDDTSGGQVTHPFPGDRLIRPRNSDTSKFGSQPNEITKYRTARVLNLLQSVILQGAQLSQPCYNHIINQTRKQNRFLTTSIGIYALIGLRMNDIHSSETAWQRDRYFVSTIIKLVNIFQPEFKDFILHHLATSYSIIHRTEFINQQRKNENTRTQTINDKLFQKSLTLKEWCRLKIKDICPQKNIDQLGLSKSLVDYCSFGLLAPNYAFKCIDEVTKYKGNFMPQHRIRLNVLLDNNNSDDEQIIENELFNNEYDDDSALSVDSFE